MPRQQGAFYRSPEDASIAEPMTRLGFAEEGIIRLVFLLPPLHLRRAPPAGACSLVDRCFDRKGGVATLGNQSRCKCGLREVSLTRLGCCDQFFQKVIRPGFYLHPLNGQ